MCMYVCIYVCIWVLKKYACECKAILMWNARQCRCMDICIFEGKRLARHAINKKILKYIYISNVKTYIYVTCKTFFNRADAAYI